MTNEKQYFFRARGALERDGQADDTSDGEWAELQLELIRQVGYARKTAIIVCSLLSPLVGSYFLCCGRNNIHERRTALPPQDGTQRRRVC